MDWMYEVFCYLWFLIRVIFNSLWRNELVLGPHYLIVLDTNKCINAFFSEQINYVKQNTLAKVCELVMRLGLYITSTWCEIFLPVYKQSCLVFVLFCSFCGFVGSCDDSKYMKDPFEVLMKLWSLSSEKYIYTQYFIY